MVECPDFKPGRHPYHHAGVFYSQEPSASSAAPLLGVRPGMRVLDLCAAPGGKSSQLAAALRGQGLLVSNEYVAARAEILKSNLERMGVPNAVVLNETPARIAAALPEFFDRVLVDAPCSGEGMFRKEPAALAQHLSLIHILLKKALEDEVNDKRLYCQRQANREFFGDSPAGVRQEGYLEAVSYTHLVVRGRHALLRHCRVVGL